jgi:hypothetical protein
MAFEHTFAPSPRSSTTLSCRVERTSSKPTTPISGSTPTLPLPNVAETSQDGIPDSSGVTEAKSMQWSDPKNTHNPFNWPAAKKWRVTLLASFMTLVIQMNGTMMTSAAEQINESFYVSDEKFPHSYWPVLSWNLGGAAAPLLGLPLMENLGVRKTYMVSPRISFVVFCADDIGNLRRFDNLHCPPGRGTELCDFDRHSHHHWRLFRRACKYYIGYRERHLEIWTSEKLWYFLVHLGTTCGTKYGPCVR